MLQPADLTGLWRRSLIVYPDGQLDSATRVCWLQGRHAFSDLRQPSGLPEFAHAASLNELSAEDCTLLATQQGFAGVLRFDGRHFEWIRRIDFQPKSLLPDAGSLTWENEVLVERGRDIAYVEHWHRNPAAAITPCTALYLHEPAVGTSALLLRVGADFMYARDRRVPTAHRTLQENVARAASLEAMRAMIDCEISAGSLTPEGYQITASTLPYRVGHMLQPSVTEGAVAVHDQYADGIAFARLFDVVDHDAEPPGRI